DPLRRIGAEVGEALDVQRPRLSRLEREQRVVDALTRAGLPDATRQLRRRSEELSGGMRQRALIASAICSSPALLIADEPTTALDATVAAGVLDLLGDLRDQGSAVLLITHDLGAARRIADDVVVLDGGEIVERGPISQVFAAPAHPTTRALLAAVPRGPRPHPRSPRPKDYGASTGSPARPASGRGPASPRSMASISPLPAVKYSAWWANRAVGRRPSPGSCSARRNRMGARCTPTPGC